MILVPSKMGYSQNLNELRNIGKKGFERDSLGKKTYTADLSTQAERDRQQRYHDTSDVTENEKIHAYNAEMKRRREHPLAPVVDGLVKMGDAVMNSGAIPDVLKKAYKTFAPVGSQYRGGGEE
jgi:hypothetical protein